MSGTDVLGHAWANRPCVLVVDDSSTNLIVAVTQLERLGIESVAAESGPRALECVASRSFDAILLDLRMPRMDGFEVARRIRALPNGADVPIVALTADVFVRDDACTAAGIDRKLSKPVGVAELRAALANYLAVDEARSDELVATIDRLAAFLGSDARVADLVEEWLRCARSALTEIPQATGSDDAPALAAALARLRGASSALQLSTLAEHALPAEKAAAAGTVDRFAAGATLTSLTRLVNEFSGWLAEQPLAESA